MTLQEQLEQRKLQWRSFNEWEAAQPLTNRHEAAIFEDLERHGKPSVEARDREADILDG